MAGKRFPLSIVLRAFDKATAPIRRVNARLQGLVAPMRRISNRMRALSKSAGLGQLANGFRRVGRAVKGVALGVGAIAAAAGLGVAGLKGLIAQGDNLAKRADRLGITVDAYAQLRHAAAQSGTEMGQFDSALEGFSKRLGEAKAGTGSLVTFLDKVSPALRKQLVDAKDTGEAFDLMVLAMSKIEDPTKRAALASAAFGRSGVVLLNLFATGPDGVNALKKEYFELAGSQEESARKSELMTDAMGRIDAAMTGVKAQILSGLAPAFLEMSEGIKNFLVENRGAIREWAQEFGKKLPGRLRAFLKEIKSIGKAIKPFWDAIGGLKGAAIALAAVLGGKLVFAVAALGKALLTTPIGLFIVGVSGLIIAGRELAQGWHLVADSLSQLADEIIEPWRPVGRFFVSLWDGIAGAFKTAFRGIQRVVNGIIRTAEKAIDLARHAAGFADDPTGKKFDKVGGPTRGSIGTRRAKLFAESLASTKAAPAPIAAPNESRIKLDITGAPRGARAEVDPRSDAQVDLSMGYQLVTP